MARCLQRMSEGGPLRYSFIRHRSENFPVGRVTDSFAVVRFRESVGHLKGLPIASLHLNNHGDLWEYRYDAFRNFMKFAFQNWERQIERERELAAP